MASKGTRSSGGFEHDFQKFCIEYWGEKLYFIEKEAKGEGVKGRPDVKLTLKKPNPKRHNPVYVEVQLDLYGDNWLEKTLEKYKNDCIIIISVSKYSELTRRQAQKRIGELLENDTKKDTPKHVTFFRMAPVKNNDYTKKCECCNTPHKKSNLRNTTLGLICRKCYRERRSELNVQ